MKNVVFTLVMLVVLTTLNSCASDMSTDQMDSLYGVDRTKVERPGNQGKANDEKAYVDRRKVERPGNQGKNKDAQAVDRRKVERPGNQGGN